MNDVAERFALAAQSLVGTPYRLYGRDPEYGLDCVGLVACALRAAGVEAHTPDGYRIRNASIRGHLPLARCNGFREVSGAPARGDLLLLTPGPAQHHLAIVTARTRLVHAHAGLRRVVVHAWSADPPPALHWRLDPKR